MTLGAEDQAQQIDRGDNQKTLIIIFEERRGDGAKSVAYSQEALRGARKGPNQLPCRVREA